MRNIILNYLENVKESMDIISLNDALGFKTVDELKELTKTLNILEKEYIVYKTKKDKFILYKKLSNLLTGKLSINKRGNGFLLNNEKDVYIHMSNLNNAIHDDLVLISLTNFKGKEEGKVVKILERKTKNLIGTIYNNKIVLDEKRKTLKIHIKDNEIIDGTKVLVNLTKEIKPNEYIGVISKVIGHINDPSVDLRTIALKHDFYEEFHKDTIKELENIHLNINDKEIKRRKDFRNLETYTIDGIDTKDIDDAVSIEYKDNIYILYVHIADVSHYIKKDSSLYNDAYNRGTSLYLANSVIPMLPKKLSNVICSLNEGEDRLALTAKMEIDEKGNTLSTSLFESIIKSDKKMDYDSINQILKGTTIKEYEKYHDKIMLMDKLSKILRESKIRDGYIDFNIPEAKLILDNDGKCIDIKKRIQDEAEMIIENFMIKTNESVASYISNMNLPFLYRVHDKPKEDRLNDFIKSLSFMGVKLKGSLRNVTPKHLQNIIKDIEIDILHELMLRSMSKAVYSEDNIGHFGLGSNNYTHFTSPIRRFPDLTIHYLIRDFIFNNEITKDKIKYYENILPEIGEHTSIREQKSIDAERETFDLKAAEYMEDKVGKMYDAVISGVVPFGFFVKLDNLVEGLVHVETLKGDHYVYMKEQNMLIGNNKGKRYRLGDLVRVKLIRASKEAREIDFEVIGGKHGNSK